MARLTVLILLLFLVLGCKEDPIPIPPDYNPPEDTTGVVSVWRTDQSGTLLLAKEVDLLPFETAGTVDVDIYVDASQSYQSIDGFGAAMTGSSAYVLMKHLSEEARGKLLEELFSPEKGIGISYLRLTMGASDFSTANYSYNDLTPGKTDFDMNEFTLSKEQDYLIPVLKEILTIVPDLSIMATPWTAPAWMKSNQNLIDGGELKPEFYAAYASYFVKYLEEMAKEGITIEAITIQNEPLHTANYPSMAMDAAAQTIFIKDYLGPALSQAGLMTKVIIYDHNWDKIQYPLEVLADNDARQYIHGTAFHCYGGEVSAMSQVFEAYPDFGIFFTECSGGEWATNFGDNLAWNTENLFVGATRNYAKTVLLWNLALDENHGPKNGGCQDCRGVVTVNSGNGKIARNVEYYLLGHIAQFVRPGAKRIETSNTRGKGISQVAFCNPDGSQVVLAFNHQSNPVKLQIHQEGEAFTYAIQGGMLATFTWLPE